MRMGERLGKTIRELDKFEMNESLFLAWVEVVAAQML